MNVAPCAEFDGWLEVTCCPNTKLSPDLLLDLDIEYRLKCGPVASRTQNNVFGLFWTMGMKKCKLFFALETKEMYDKYTAFLESVLRSLEEYKIGKFFLHFIAPQAESIARRIELELEFEFYFHLITEQAVIYTNVEQSHSTDVVVESGNRTQEMVPMPVIVDGGLSNGSMRISDASGICHEVQLRRTNRNRDRRVRRPIAVIGDFIATKRAKSVGAAPKLSPRNHHSIDDFVISRPKIPLKTKKSSWRSSRNEKIWLDSNWITEPIIFEKSIEEPQNDVNLNFGRFVNMGPVDKAFAWNEATSTGSTKKTANTDFAKAIETKQPNDPLNLFWSTGGNSDTHSLGANAISEQIQNEIFVEKDQRPLSPAPTFITFGKVAKVDENGYAIMRPIIRDNTSSPNSPWKTDSLHTTYVSMNGDAMAGDNVEQTPIRRKVSFDDGSSSGCSSDGEDKKPTLRLKKCRFSDTDFVDEAISMKYNSMSSSSPNITSSSHDSYETQSPTKRSETSGSGNDIDLPPKLVRRSNMRNRSKVRLVAPPFVPSSPMNIRRPIMINSALSVEKIPGFGSNETMSVQHDIPSANAFAPKNRMKVKATKILNEINLNIKLKTKRIRRTCTDIRDIAASIVSLPRAMHNFLN